MNLLKQSIPVLDPPCVSEQAEDARNELVQSALVITAIATADQNRIARNVAVELRAYLKSVESARVELTVPFLNAQRLLKSLADDHVAPLKLELDRLERLATVWLVAERSRAEAEEKARLALVQDCKTESDYNAIANLEIVAAERAHGQTLRQVMKITVTDIIALARARPELVRMEPNLAAINAVCVPGMSNLPPGLVLSYETRSTYSTR